MSSTKSIPNADLPFGKFKTMKDFSTIFGVRMDKLLNEENLLNDNHTMKVGFKDKFKRFLMEMMGQVIKGDVKWCKSVAAELCEDCFMIVAAMNKCNNSEELSKAMREENLKEFVYNFMMLKLFDYDSGLVPPLFGAKPFGGA